MRLHSFYCSFRIVGAVLAVPLSWYCRNVGCNWLFTIIEGLHHTSLIWWCLWQQEVVLEYSISCGGTCSTAAVSFWMTGSCFGSCALHVLHKAALSFTHLILGRGLFVWIVESGSCCIGASAEVTCMHILVLLHQNNAIILETLIKTDFMTSDRSTTTWEFSSIAYFSMSLVKWICSTICRWLSTTTHGSMVTSHILLLIGSIWTFTAVGSEARTCHIHRLLSRVSTIVQIVRVVMIILSRITNTTTGSLLA